MKNKMNIGLLASLALATTFTFSKGNDVPELQGAEVYAAGSPAKMKCLVDTPAWDSWGYGNCFSVGFARTTTAFFQIDGGPSNNFIVYWSDSRCSQSSKSCSLPIMQYRSVNLSAHILDLSNNTFESTSATAMYEGFH